MSAAVLAALIVTLPYLSILSGAVRVGAAWQHLRETVLLRYVVNTVVLTTGSVGFAVLFGTVGAWILYRYAVPARRLLEVIFVAPLAVPVYIGTFTWSGILSYGGAVQRWSGLALPFYGIPAAIFILAIGLYPYVFLTVYTALHRDTATLFEAVAALSDLGGRYDYDGRQVEMGAQRSGRFRLAYMRKIARGVVPVLRPAIVGGAALVAMETLNAYATPVYLGVETLSTGVFRTWFALDDLTSATRLAALVLAIILTVLGLERLGRGRRRFVAGETRPPTVPIRLGRFKTGLVVAAVLLPATLGFVIPVIQLIDWTVSGGPGAFTGVIASAGRSVLLAAITTVGIVLAAVVVNYAAYLRPGRIVRAFRAVASIGYAVPGTVVAIGVLGVFGALRRVNEEIFLFGTIGGLTFAYAARYAAVAMQPIRAAFERQHRSTIDAARSLGGSTVRVLHRIVVPIIRPTIASASLLVAIDVIKDIPITLLLRPFDFSTLAVDVYRLASDERVPEAAPRALLLVFLGILTISVIMKGAGERGAHRTR